MEGKKKKKKRPIKKLITIENLKKMFFKHFNEANSY